MLSSVASSYNCWHSTDRCWLCQKHKQGSSFIVQHYPTPRLFLVMNAISMQSTDITHCISSEKFRNSFSMVRMHRRTWYSSTINFSIYFFVAVQAVTVFVVVWICWLCTVIWLQRDYQITSRLKKLFQEPIITSNINRNMNDVMQHISTPDHVLLRLCNRCTIHWQLHDSLLYSFHIKGGKKANYKLIKSNNNKYIKQGETR